MEKEIILYHGSENIIENPIFGTGKKYNDYGLGFYCTKSKKLASEWAVDKNRDGYINKYNLDLNNLKILNLNQIDYPILTWLAVLIQNRTFDSYTQVQASAKDFLIQHFNINYNDYDIIVGYRADDSYFQFAKAFLNSAITYKTLTNAMYLGNLGNQYVLKSKRAFDSISFCNYENVASIDWYNNKVEREEKARKLYSQSKNMRIQNDDIFFSDIIRGRLNEKENESLRQGISTSNTRSSRSDT